jgi:hypothetical protein
MYIILENYIKSRIRILGEKSLRGINLPYFNIKPLNKTFLLMVKDGRMNCWLEFKKKQSFTWFHVNGYKYF